MRIALFGASGFLGRAVARALEAAGHTAGPTGRVEITDPAALDRLEIEADAVVNCAARVPSAPATLPEHAALFAANAVGATHLARWAVARGIGRIVHCSTLAVVSRPWPVPLTEEAPTGSVAAYAASKLAGELTVAATAASAGASCAVLRLSALYGPGMRWAGVLPTLIDDALSGRRLRASRGAHADFLHVDDAARAVVRAAEVGATGIFNVAAGVETRIPDLASAVLAACDRPADALDIVESPAAHAVVSVTRMRGGLGVESRIPLARGISELVAARTSSR